ncbi:hypothetical protein PB2503_12834 [Parvularcula bermudensis HTCC2503]|uniref:Uncharacterized protein n=1 Tax=Parvularcula bermudensis (strain ATCC BAA-594 / HTCC2503 / KCTC 12087) TaxID=314260 RepID=E0TG33_PARBH|nr:YdbH domain-containing protein [Parvularcula bermudensis]ADM10604.1 hypothetical protein PB2503_12834 [Parvularcula bermudensis HTCC2503]
MRAVLALLSRPFAILAQLFMAVVIARAPLTEQLVSEALHQRGLTDLELDIHRLALTGADFVVDAPPGSGIPRGTLSVVYDPADVLFSRRVDRVHLDKAAVTLSLDSRGRPQLPSIKRGEGSQRFTLAALPFEEFVISDSTFLVETPEGLLRTQLDARFTQQAGLTLDANIVSEGAGLTPRITSDGSLTLSVEAPREAPLRAVYSFAGDVAVADHALSSLIAEGEVTLSAWEETLLLPTEADLSGTVEIVSGVLHLGERFGVGAGAPLLMGEAAASAPLAVSGTLDARYEDGRVTLSTVAPPALRLAGIEGASVTVLPRGEAIPLAQFGPNGMAVSVRMAVASPTGEGEFTLATRPEVPDDIAFTADLADLHLAGLSAAALRAEGHFTPKDRRGVVNLITSGAGTRLGPLHLDDLTLTGSLAALLPEEGGYEVAIPEAAQLRVEQGRLSTDQTTFTLNGGTILPAASALVKTTGGKAPLRVAARARSWSLTAQAGQTKMAVNSLDTDLSVIRELSGTTIDAEIGGGAGTVNRALTFDRLKGAVALTLPASGAAKGTARLDRLILGEARQIRRVNDIAGRGHLRLAHDQVRFDIDVTTPAGQPLGTLEGHHRLAGNQGRADFSSGPLRFEPSGLQPAGLVPALSGIIGPTTGTATVTAGAAWGDGLRTNAEVSLDRLTFQGPGVAVKSTRDVNGVLVFDQLFPPRTPETQTLKIGMLDIYALDLEEGEVSFRLPGDQSVIVERAVFPWFGGAVSVEESRLAFDGSARAVLKASDLDLGLILAFADIEGLTGTGRLSGTLPLDIERLNVRLDDGVLRSTEPGTIRYSGPAQSLGDTNRSARLAFDVLENLRYDALSVRLNGPLDGDVDFNFSFEGLGDIRIDDPRVREEVTTPVKLNAAIEVPLLSLIEQARLSVTPELQIQRFRTESAAPPE